MADIYSLTIRADTRDVKRARGDLGMLSESAARASRENQRLARTSQTVAKASRFSSNGLRQTSMQLSQVAQQASATGNWVQALAIQLPDLALAFGPVGIALGAVAGGLLSYVSSANDAEEETKTLIQRIDGLSVEYDDLNDSIRETLRLERARAQAAIEDQLAEQREQLRLAEQRVRSYNNALNATGQAGARFGGAVNPERLQDAKENVIELGGEIGFLELQLSETTKRYDEYINGTDSAADAAEKQAEKLEQLVEGLQRQADVVGLNARETALYEAARLGANAADIEAINNSFDIIESYRRQQEAQKALMESTKIGVKDDPMLQRIEAERRGQELITEITREEEEERRRIREQGIDASLSITSQFFGTLAGIAQKGGKEQFQAYQNLASAEAAVATALAVTKALGSAPPPINIGLATAVGAMGALQIAEIQSQQYQGARQMGGSVSAGGRYLVGENGPEIVTMGGSGVVTPSSVTNRGGDTNITQVLQVPGNIQQEVKQQIMAAMPLIRNTAINAVSTEINRGGNMARQVGRRS